MGKPCSKRQRNADIAGWLLIAPQVIGYLLFVAFPLVFSLVLCFSDWNLITAPVLIGLDNFERIFGDRIFWMSMGNTFLYILMVVPVTLVCSLTLAILTNRKLPLKRFYRAAFFLPMVTSTVAISMVWSFIYQPETGILNSILMAFGVSDPPYWLGDARYARIAVAIVSIWLKLGYYYLIFDAGIKNIPQDLYDAAMMDGASPLRRVFSITVPMLGSVMFFVTVMLFIDVFNMFNEVYMMTGGGPDFSTYTMSMYIYNYAFGSFSDMGRAAVASCMLFLLVGIVTLIQFIIKKKAVYEA